MRMQEPEQWQSSQEYSQGYSADSGHYSEEYDSEQEQKIYPQKSRWLDGTALAIFALIFSSIGFFLTVAGIVASAIVLQFRHTQQAILAGSHNRTAKLYWSDAYVYCHLRVCYCHIGITSKKNPWDPRQPSLTIFSARTCRVGPLEL